jgi:dTDP-4-amino-4,6-dideoxygalactose transaminase
MVQQTHQSFRCLQLDKVTIIRVQNKIFEIKCDFSRSDNFRKLYVFISYGDKFMTDIGRKMFYNKEMKSFKKKVWLSSPTMHGQELKFMTEAFKTNWMSTVGKNIDEIERLTAEKIGVKYAVALSAGTAALHLAVKLAGVKPGDKVFCSDMTFGATVNPVVYEGGMPVFIDTEYDTWNMDPMALEKAFELYPEVKVIVVAHLYGTPGKINEIKAIANKHNAFIIEDAAESLGATYNGIQTGSFGNVGCISYNGNKIITGSAGGMLLTNDINQANKVRKWSTQARDNAPWYQHEELGYNYRMSNVIAGVARGQWPYLEEHIRQKTKIYERYKKGFKNLPVKMNPYDANRSVPNHWLSCMIIDKDAMCPQARDEHQAVYRPKHSKSCPTEILETLAKFNAEGRPIWKPMHLQPIYRMNCFITKESNGRGCSDAYIKDMTGIDFGADIFDRGLCLPSDNKMTVEEQNRVIDIIRECFA